MPDAQPVTTETTATASLRHLFARGGPFTTVVMRAEALEDDLASRWAQVRSDSEAGGAVPRSLDAIEAQLAAPIPEDIGAIYFCASADGVAVGDVGEEGPGEDFFHVGALPYAAPLIEWTQWQVPHLVVRLDASGRGQVFSVRDGGHEVFETDSFEEAVLRCRDLTQELRVHLVVVTGEHDADAEDLVPKLKTMVPVDVDVRVATADDVERAGDLANEVVRQVADHVARRTVRRLEDFRFLLEHNGAVQGATATLEALSRGWGDLLLIHDDPSDSRTAWFGSAMSDLSAAETDGWTEARLVDVAIRAAIGAGVEVQIVPSTGPQGPDDDIGLLKTELAPESDGVPT